MLKRTKNFNYLKYYRPDLTNKQINEYLDFIEVHNNPNDTRYKRHGHHIIPKNYFVYDDNISDEDKEELYGNLTYLTIKQHAQAHKMLGDEKSARLLIVHRTFAYQKKMEDVLKKEWSDPKYVEKFRKNSIIGTKRKWKTDAKYVANMKHMFSECAKKSNASEEFQYNKKEKMIFDCLYKIASQGLSLSYQTWIQNKLHNTPNYLTLLIKYCHILIQYCNITLTDIKKECKHLGSSNTFWLYGNTQYTVDDFRHHRKELFDPKRKLTYDFKHWSKDNKLNDLLEKLKTLKLCTR